jgi:hypothetical protein
VPGPLCPLPPPFPCGRLRPTDAYAAWHPQPRARDWDPWGFLCVDAVVRRNRVSTMVGQYAACGPRDGACENRWHGLPHEGPEASDILEGLQMSGHYTIVQGIRRSFYYGPKP